MITRPQFFATIAAFFGVKASAQLVDVNPAAISAGFKCHVCKKFWKQSPSMVTSACAVYHGLGSCCHYGQVEVPAPVDAQVADRKAADTLVIRESVTLDINKPLKQGGFTVTLRQYSEALTPIIECPDKTDATFALIEVFYWNLEQIGTVTTVLLLRHKTSTVPIVPRAAVMGDSITGIDIKAVYMIRVRLMRELTTLEWRGAEPKP